MDKLKMSEIAARIDAHLKRFEADYDGVNLFIYGKPANGRRFQSASVVVGRQYIAVEYRRLPLPMHGPDNLTKADALAYLAWLDAGNIGTYDESKRKESN